MRRLRFCLRWCIIGGAPLSVSLSNMQSVQEFLTDYFRSRTDILRQQARLREPHYQRYLAPNYQMVDPERGFRNSANERILEVTKLDKGCQVITSGLQPAMGRLKYHVSTTPDSWQIQYIERECFLCHGSGSHGEGSCHPCGGKGWSLLGEVLHA